LVFPEFSLDIVNGKNFPGSGSDFSQLMESYLMLLSKFPRVFMTLLFKVVHILARGHRFCIAKNGRVPGAYPRSPSSFFKHVMVSENPDQKQHPANWFDITYAI
jgi:hypothetical protein